MRFATLAAALLLAAPAAAQPDAPRILTDAVHRMAVDLTEVEGYSFTLAYGAVRTPVYVHRTGQSWTTSMGPTRLGDVMGLAVFWPGLLDPGELAGVYKARYVRAETVEGRPAHVVAAPGMEYVAAKVDSAFVFVDAETLDVLRVFVAAGVPPEMGEDVFGPGARMLITLDAGGHRETDGLRLPGELRVRMQVHAPGMPPETRRRMLDQVAAVRAQLRGAADPEGLETLALVDTYEQLLSPGGMDVRMTVDDVRVNPGPPEWLGGGRR